MILAFEQGELGAARLVGSHSDIEEASADIRVPLDGRFRAAGTLNGGNDLLEGSTRGFTIKPPSTSTSPFLIKVCAILKSMLP